MQAGRLPRWWRPVLAWSPARCFSRRFRAEILAGLMSPRLAASRPFASAFPCLFGAAGLIPALARRLDAPRPCRCERGRRAFPSRPVWSARAGAPLPLGARRCRLVDTLVRGKKLARQHRASTVRPALARSDGSGHGRLQASRLSLATMSGQRIGASGPSGAANPAGCSRIARRFRLGRGWPTLVAVPAPGGLHADERTPGRNRLRPEWLRHC